MQQFELVLHIWDPEKGPTMTLCGLESPARVVSPAFADRLDRTMICEQCTRLLAEYNSRL